ncbi:MAG: hypothetical protein JWO20_2544 [Candidatus Angelobacter sp.]|nr:hypothetical protein [Candidatus Angelobacter sp.]
MAIVASAQDRPSVQRSTNLPIADWISQGERQEIPWEVRVTKPELTFQQRMLVTVFAEIHSDELQKRNVNRDLHFLVKVADESGNWMDDESYVPFRLTEKMDRRTDLQMQTELYLKPGNFKVAIIAYDSALGERSVSFSRVQVDRVERDPFPDLLSSVPPVQFLPSPTEGLVVFGMGRINLPVVTQRPVQFDLIVDLSAYEYDSARTPVPRPMFGAPRGFPRPIPVNRPAMKNDRKYLDRLIQTASVLSQMHFEKGCTRVTAVDVLNRSVIVPTTVDAVNWQHVRKNVLGPDHNLVSVSALGGKDQVPGFVSEQLEKVMAAEPSCAAESGKPVHVIAVLTHGVEIEARSKTKVEQRCNCEVFYLKQDDNHLGVDDLKKMVSPLSPRVLEFRNPLEFRRKLADLLQEMEKTSAAN